MRSIRPHRRTTWPKALAMSAAAALLAAACSSSAPSPSPGGTGAAGEPIDGGTLRVGIVGGSVKDTLDAHNPITHPDEARVIALYEPLATFDPDYKLHLALADKITPSADAKKWTVHLRDGLKFSDGSPITSADVAATFQRITDPENPKYGTSALSGLLRDQIKTPDAQTTVLPFKEPFVIFPEVVAAYYMSIVPKNYDPKKPISSGPFVYSSFTPGQQSTFTKNPNYWREDEPHLDKLVVIDFPDDTARVNALLGGQVDAIDQLPLGQINVVESNANLEVLESETGSWIPFTMRVDQPPFDDVRVRQAFQLIVDRKQMIEQVLGGHGRIGNDMYAPLDPCYPKDIPQRTQDIAKAKKLLAEAGKSDLTVELVTSPAAAGFVEAATVFTEQAKAAGVTVKINRVDPGVFYGDGYLKWTFSQDFWFTRGYLFQAANGGLPGAPFNETHWNNPKWNALIRQASATLDETKRCSLIAQAQKIEHDEGGYIIWGFPNNLDAHSVRVHGFVPDKSGAPLTTYGFRSVWLSQ